MNTSTLAAALLLASAASAADVSSGFEPDCKNVVFQPEDAPVSKPVNLSSQEWVVDCFPSSPAGQDCWERPGKIDSLRVQVTLAQRPPLLPWESDVFQVCLTGPMLAADPVSTAYDYRVVRDGTLDGNVVFAAGSKRLLPPDPRGVQAALTPELSLVFKDQWAAYYPGEAILLKIELKKESSFWPDETVLENEIALPVASGYTLNLGKAAGEGGIYYAKYSIKRLGGLVSTEAETPALQTGKVSFTGD